MTDAKRQLEERLDALMQDLPNTGTISLKNIRELLAKRPQEPEPVGYEYFEHLREEGA